MNQTALKRLIDTRLSTATSRAFQDGKRDDLIGETVSAESDRQLSDERRRTDLATGLERTRVDAAILAQRKVANKLVTQVLELEIIATDENLMTERTTSGRRRLSRRAMNF